MPKGTSKAPKKVPEDKSAFNDIMGILIPTPPIGKAALKPMRKPRKKRAKQA